MVDSPMTTLRILLADDHPIVRGGLKALIDGQPDMTVVGEACDGVEALERAQALRPDVVIMDLSMPNVGGAESTQRIKEVCPEVKVLALTAHEERGYAELALRAGASGYVLKRTTGEDLVRAIRAVAGGGVYLDPSIAAQVGVGRQGPGANVTHELSEREGEVLRMIAQGHAMKEIAAALSVGTRTLETYRARAMEKLALKTRAEVVRYAVQRGWLTDD